jgi:hypothetical protein
MSDGLCKEIGHSWPGWLSFPLPLLCSDPGDDVAELSHDYHTGSYHCEARNEPLVFVWLHPLAEDFADGMA